MSEYRDNLLHPIDDNVLWNVFQYNYTDYFLNRTRSIPKKIHQIWLGGEIPDKYTYLITTWLDKHPDWEYKLWTDKDVKSLSMVNMPLFVAMDNLGAKSDILRYEIIFQYGGIYADTDFLCIQPFDDFLHLDFFSGSGPSAFPFAFNGLFGARPQHPILKKAITELSRMTLSSEKNYTEIMKKTGPDFFSKIVLSYVLSMEDRSVIFPEAFFYPFPMEERFDNNIRNCTDFSKALKHVKDKTYAVHLWHTSWQK